MQSWARSPDDAGGATCVAGGASSPSVLRPKEPDVPKTKHAGVGNSAGPGEHRVHRLRLHEIGVGAVMPRSACTAAVAASILANAALRSCSQASSSLPDTVAA